MNTAQILVIEDDACIRRVLRTTLAAEGYCVTEASTVEAGVLLATQRVFDVIVLDLLLPDGNGIQVIQKVRKAKRNVPILVVSACPDVEDKIAALDAGADDFINKPVAMAELLARVRAALRRCGPVSIYRTGEIEVNLNNRRVGIGGKEVDLTRIEFKLLAILIRHADEIVTPESILKEVWGPGHEAQIHDLRIYMVQLRRKLEADPGRPRYLLTVPGVGYRLATQHFPEAWEEKQEIAV